MRWNCDLSVQVLTWCYEHIVYVISSSGLGSHSLSVYFYCPHLQTVFVSSVPREYFNTIMTASQQTYNTTQSVCLCTVQMKARNTLLGLFWEMNKLMMLGTFWEKHMKDKTEKSKQEEDRDRLMAFERRLDRRTKKTREKIRKRFKCVFFWEFESLFCCHFVWFTVLQWASFKFEPYLVLRLRFG